MNHIKQAEMLKRSIRKASLNLRADCMRDLDDDELVFRFEALRGILLIASQELSALIASWKAAESLAETLPTSDDNVFTVAPDWDCEFCNGDGVGQNGLCECVMDELPEGFSGRVDIALPNAGF